MTSSPRSSLEDDIVSFAAAVDHFEDGRERGIVGGFGRLNGGGGGVGKGTGAVVVIIVVTIDW